jgi:hypothetical protein
MRIVPFVVVASALLAAAACGQETARRRGAAESRPSFVRVAGQGAEKRLETAWSVLRDDAGREVWLVGAVHVADRDYFAALDGLLGAADLVLYEGVAGEPTPDMTTIARLQLALGRILDLSFQKDGVTYGRPHFVHADLTLQEIERRLAEKGETLLPGGDVLKMFGPLLARFMEAAGKQAEAAKARGDASPFGMIKRQVAGILADPAATQSAFSRGWDEVVIGARNAHAIETLRGLLNGEARTFAIFYGAAHLPDFERRLQDLGFRPCRKEWLTAWRLGADAPAPSAVAPTAVRPFI